MKIMKFKKISIILFVLVLSSICYAENLSTTFSKKVADPSVYFSSAGPYLYFTPYSNWRYRVSLLIVTIYPEIVIEKVRHEREYEGEGDYEKDYKAKVAWSRILNMPFNVYPNEFAKSFKWRSSTSFSFIHENIEYIIEKIDTKMPVIKKKK
jgi:hypothetical protein